MPNRPRPRILVADDHVPFRRDLVEVLARQPDFEVVAEASYGVEAVQLRGGFVRAGSTSC